MRSVVVTGASTGIGRASALQMDAAGWRVFAGVRREKDAESLREAGSGNLIPLKLDITDREQVGAAAETIAESVADAGLDGLVNNAGITIPCPLEAMPLDDFNRLIAVNMTGQLAVTQALLPQLRKSKGRVVFVSSISGRRGMPMLAGYCASKAGLNALADGLRQELRPWRVGVSIVEPGSVETPIWERGEKELDDSLTQSSVDVERLYGKLIEAFRKVTDRVLEQRLPPQRVVVAIEHALTAGKPRLRYVVGRDAKAQAFATRLLPDRVLDFGTARYLSL